MSLRLRLGLWYGGLTGLVVLLVGLFLYAAHTRGHYDDLDYTLQTTAAHMAQEYEATGTTPAPVAGTPAVISQSLAVRVYDAAGQVVAASPAAAQAPPADPRSILLQPTGPAFDPVAALAPPFTALAPGDGAFGLARAGAGVRWRVYALPFAGGSRFLLVAAALERLDASIVQFRWLTLLLTVAGAGLTLLAGWLLAARALRPVATLTDTAGGIAHSRSFRRRVPVGNSQDELGRLARTFNDMLGSLEGAYQAQQRFVSDASHELRAPLTAIQANLDLLVHRPEMVAAERQEAISEASREAQRLARLVADLLALARADAGVTTRHEPVELDRVLLEALSDARHLLRGQHLRVADLEPTIVLGDADRLKQLLFILLDNAIKYTPPTGQISAGLRRDGPQAEITIRDSGIGIPAEDLGHVFDRFYRADPARSRDPGGSGLGLPIAHWIVEQHGGEIRLESRPGAGTTAIVRLPIPSA